MTKIKLALDWSPNTIHAGFFYAFYKGWYKEVGIALSFIDPEDDNYRSTPCKQVANGTAHFAIAPSESVLSYRTLPSPIPLVAVATLMQEDTSAIVTLSSSGIDRPKKMDGKIYGSYEARYEDCIVKKMIRNDGGFGMLQVQYPPKLKIFDLLLEKKVDASWVFMPWEGVRAKRAGIALNAFALKDYKIPYGYSPLLISSEAILEQYPDSVSRFLEISARGFEAVANNVEEAASFLCAHVQHKDFLDKEFILESLTALQSAWLKDGEWGKMDKAVWDEFIGWLTSNKVLCDLDGEYIEKIRLTYLKMFTNTFFKH